jgi:cation:H+ antiporter
MPYAVAWFVVGLVVLILGAEFLVRGASRLARRLGVPALVVGLTIVAFGTSAPEFAVTVASALKGEPDVALGNAVGSNIFNVLAIVGAAALIRPLPVKRRLIRFDAPIMIAATVALLALALNRRLDRGEGLVLVAGLVAYTVFAYVWARREKEHPDVAAQFETAHPIQGSTPLQILALLAGFVMLSFGSRWMVDGAVRVAEELGVSRAIVALTIVAAGTGMPELATSVMAGLRNEPDIAVGNIVGSNIFNILGAVGLSATVAPSGMTVNEKILTTDGPMMLLTLLLLWQMCKTGRRVGRGEGAVLFAAYIAYVAFAVVRAG